MYNIIGDIENRNERETNKYCNWNIDWQSIGFPLAEI